MHVAIARSWEAIDSVVVFGRWEPGTSKDGLQPADLGWLGKVNSQANKRDLLSKVNHLKWHKIRSSFPFFSSKMCWSSSIKHICYLGTIGDRRIFNGYRARIINHSLLWMRIYCQTKSIKMKKETFYFNANDNLI